MTSSGVYMIITSKRIFFWIGQSFFDDYLDDTTYKKQ